MNVTNAALPPELRERMTEIVRINRCSDGRGEDERLTEE
jgi:hypothetical protein